MNSRHLPRPSRAHTFNRGMTLVEIMVVLGICMLVVGGVLATFIQGIYVYHYDSAKLLVNRDMRAFTSEITDNATYANRFNIYPSFTDRSVIISGVTYDNKMASGQSGNLLVLIYLDSSDSSKVNRLVGYYRDPNQVNGEAPVRKFDITISPSSSADVWTLLPATSTAQTNTEVIELSKNVGTQNLFYNFYGRSVMVKCDIIHRTNAGANHYQRATNTYNFTISPRG